MTLSFEVRFPSVTGYGTGVSVGSRPFVGDRDLEGLPPNPYLHDVLEVHHFSGSEGTPGFTASLLGRRVWTGIAGDSSWHKVTLELRGLTYTLSIDGQEVGTAVSYWRPYSLIVGSPAVVETPGRWSEVAVRNARLELCAKAMQLPLVVRRSVEPRRGRVAPCGRPATPAGPVYDGRQERPARRVLGPWEG